MIVGIGVDVVDVPRFAATLARTPRLLPRLFAPAERPLKPRSLAARYAAKEALIKALGGSDGVHWTDIEVASESSGRPVFSLRGETAETVAARGITALHLSMSHDAGLATAYVIAEADGAAAPPAVIPALQPATASAGGASDEIGAPAVIPALQPALETPHGRVGTPTADASPTVVTGPAGDEAPTGVAGPTTDAAPAGAGTPTGVAGPTTDDAPAGAGANVEPVASAHTPARKDTE